MKKNYYQKSMQIAQGVYLCVCFFSDRYILLNEEIYSLYEAGNLEQIEFDHPDIFHRLIEGLFIIEDSFDEYQEIINLRRKEIEDCDLYQVIVNPTLDCNLSCWYCYENRIPKSMMENDTAEATQKHLEYHYNEKNYNTLKLSFFGGEPFVGFKIMKQIIVETNKFCQKKGVNLLLDFTTNGTLCTPTILEFLSNFRCTFQITLDGNREQHNKIKYTKSRKFDTFAATTSNIRSIQSYIENSFIAVRINYDKDTLRDFDSILSELLPLDRRRTKIILKKIWQVKEDDISKEYLFMVMERLFENEFIVDFYSRGGVCFADRWNQAVINYDGRVFKCTTISKFDEFNALGILDKSSGQIVWNPSKLQYLFSDTTPVECKTCCMFPSCGGPCRKRLAEDPNWSCFLKNASFDMDDYVLTQFKSHLIKSRIYAKLHLA